MLTVLHVSRAQTHIIKIIIDLCRGFMIIVIAVFRQDWLENTWNSVCWRPGFRERMFKEKEVSSQILDIFMALSSVLLSSASAHAELQQHRSESLQRRGAPLSGGIPPPDYLDRDEDGELIKPRKLVNPVKSSRSHQELHRELLSSCKR